MGERGARAFTVIPMGTGWANRLRIGSFENFSGLWPSLAVRYLMLRARMGTIALESNSLIKEVVNGTGFGSVGLHMKGTLPSQLLAFSGNQPALWLDSPSRSSTTPRRQGIRYRN